MRRLFPAAYELFQAVTNGSVADVAARLAGGDDPNARSAWGNTPLSLTVHARWGLAKADLLYARGGDVNAWDGRGVQPIHAACESSHHLAQADWLLRHGADSNSQTDSDAEFGGWSVGWAPLHFAARASALETVDLLLRFGADPNRIAFDGRTPLHVAAAAFKTYKRLMRRLVDGGAGVNAQDSDGQTPLHVLAAGHGRYRLTCARFLASRGADASIRTNARAVAADGVVDGQPCSAEMRRLLSRRPTSGS